MADINEQRARAEHEAETLCHISGNVEAETLIETLADTLGEAEAVILGHTLGDVEMEALIDTMADTLLQTKAMTPIKTIGVVEALNLFCFLVYLGGMETLAHTDRHASGSKHLNTC